MNIESGILIFILKCNFEYMFWFVDILFFVYKNEPLD